MDERTCRTDRELAPSARRLIPEPFKPWVKAPPRSRWRIGIGTVVLILLGFAVYETVHWVRTATPPGGRFPQGAVQTVGASTAALGDVRVVLNELRDLGIKIAIDDFGVGYSSLSYLRELPIDEVKLDRSFIAPITTDRGAAAIVRSVIDLSHNLNLSTVAEGVETAGAAAMLRSYGCDTVQGHYFCRPVTAAELGQVFGSGRPPAGTPKRDTLLSLMEVPGEVAKGRPDCLENPSDAVLIDEGSQVTTEISEGDEVVEKLRLQ